MTQFGITRRMGLAGLAASFAGVAQADPGNWRALDAKTLDADYDQSNFAPNIAQITARFVTRSAETLQRLGAPLRVAYGPSADETLDIYRAPHARAPIFIFLHGGAWRSARARDCGFLAEMFVAHGVHFVVPDFAWVQNVGGDLGVVVDQVRRAVAWAFRNAGQFGGDGARLYVAGHSSGGHLAAMCLVTDWGAMGVPRGIIKAGLCISGIYDLEPVRHTSRAGYIRLSDDIVQRLSPIRQIDQVRAPVTVLCGTAESPEFQRQAGDFAAALQGAGRLARFEAGAHYNHFDMMESLASPYAIAGRAALGVLGV